MKIKNNVRILRRITYFFIARVAISKNERGKVNSRQNKKYEQSRISLKQRFRNFWAMFW